MKINMENNKEVIIKISYAGNQPLVSLLESKFDFEHVDVSCEKYAVKALIPLSILISTTALYFFEKLILDPLIEPLAEKYNWIDVAKKTFRINQQINIVIKIKESNFLEAIFNSSHKITPHMWNIIKQALEIIKSEELIEKISKIRIITDSEDKYFIICYEMNKPTFCVSIDEKKIYKIEPTDSSKIELLSENSWSKVINDFAEKNNNYINKIP